MKQVSKTVFSHLLGNSLENDVLSRFLSNLAQWALCMKLSYGIKSALLDGKLRTGTSKTKKSHAWLVEIAL